MKLKQIIWDDYALGVPSSNDFVKFSGGPVVYRLSGIPRVDTPVDTGRV